MPSLDEQAMLSALGATGRVEVNDLAQRLEVSTDTMPKNLDALEQRTLLRRVRGDAVAAPVVGEGSIETRPRIRRA